MAKSVRLTVGASADRSIGRVFESFVQASARARVQVAANMNAALAGGAGGADKAGRALELLNRQALRQIAQIERAQSAARSREESAELASLRRKQRAEVAAFDARLEMSKRASAEERRQIDANAREAERRMRTANDNGVRSRTAVLSQSYSNVAGVARSTLGVARDLGRGAGVDFDLSAALGRSGSTEKLATDVTNSAFAARGLTAGRSDVEATIASIQAAGDAAKVSYADAAAGLTEFVAKSADLEVGKETLGDLAKLARATGTNVRDLVSAAGDVSKELDGGADKGQRLMEVMRLVARQGALGNVEIRNLATYMGRITGTAALFAGGREENIGKLGAIAQLAMKGGRVTAAEATNTSAAIFRDLTKPHAIEAFEKAGIGLFADKGKTKMRGPDEILMDVVSKSQGDVTKISDLMKNQVSRAAAISLAKIFNENGGGSAGRAAMEAEFKKYTTSMTGSQVESAAALSMGTREAAAQDFNNRMEKIAASLGDKLLPAFEKLTPTILEATDAWAGVVSWAADNPGMAITSAITASIAKAAIGESISRAVVSGLAGTAGGGGGIFGGYDRSKGFMGGMGAAGNLGAGLAIAATAVTLYAAGSVVIDSALGDMKGGAEQQENQQFARENTISRLSRKLAGGGELTAEDQRALAQARQATEMDIAAGTDKKGVLGALNPFSSTTFADVGRSDQAEANMEALRADLAKIEALQKGIADLNAKLGGTLQVQVTNMPGGAAGVDGESRSGP